MPTDQRLDAGIEGRSKKGLDEGEERAWYRLALRLGHKSVEECKLCISSTEFLRWQKVFEDEYLDRTRPDWHAAILAYQIYILPFRFFGGKSTLELEDFLLKFTLEKPVQKKMDSEEEEALLEAKKKHMAEASKAAWLGMMDIDTETGKPKTASSLNPLQKELARQIAERDAAIVKETAEKAAKKGN